MFLRDWAIFIFCQNLWGCLLFLVSLHYLVLIDQYFTAGSAGTTTSVKGFYSRSPNNQRLVWFEWICCRRASHCWWVSATTWHFVSIESCLFFSWKPAAVLPRVDARLGGSVVVLRRPGKSSERTSHSPAVSRWPHMDHVTSGRTQRTCHQVHWPVAWRGNHQQDPRFVLEKI